MNSEAQEPKLWIPEMGPRVRPRANENLLITGKTQSGKSELLAYFFAPAARHHPAIIIDPKMSQAMKRLSDLKIDTDAPEIPPVEWYIEMYRKWGRYPVLRYVPDAEAGIGRDEKLDLLERRILKRKNMLIVYDETATLCDAHRYTKGMKMLYQLGQEGNIGVWAINQRSIDIPKFMVSAANLLVSFWMGDQSDRDRLSECGVSFDIAAALDPYEYALYQHGKSRAVTIYSPLDLKKRKEG